MFIGNIDYQTIKVKQKKNKKKKKWRQKQTKFVYISIRWALLVYLVLWKWILAFALTFRLKTLKIAELTRTANCVANSLRCVSVKCNFGVLKLTPTLLQVTDFVN